MKKGLEDESDWVGFFVVDGLKRAKVLVRSKVLNI